MHYTCYENHVHASYALLYVTCYQISYFLRASHVHGYYALVTENPHPSPPYPPLLLLPVRYPSPTPPTLFLSHPINFPSPNSSWSPPPAFSLSQPIPFSAYSHSLLPPPHNPHPTPRLTGHLDISRDTSKSEHLLFLAVWSFPGNPSKSRYRMSSESSMNISRYPHL